MTSVMFLSNWAWQLRSCSSMVEQPFSVGEFWMCDCLDSLRCIIRTPRWKLGLDGDCDKNNKQRWFEKVHHL